MYSVPGWCVSRHVPSERRWSADECVECLVESGLVVVQSWRVAPRWPRRWSAACPRRQPRWPEWGRGRRERSWRSARGSGAPWTTSAFRASFATASASWPCTWCRCACWLSSRPTCPPRSWCASRWVRTRCRCKKPGCVQESIWRFTTTSSANVGVQHGERLREPLRVRLPAVHRERRGGAAGRRGALLLGRQALQPAAHARRVRPGGRQSRRADRRPLQAPRLAQEPRRRRAQPHAGDCCLISVHFRHLLHCGAGERLRRAVPRSGGDGGVASAGPTRAAQDAPAAADGGQGPRVAARASPDAAGPAQVPPAERLLRPAAGARRAPDDDGDDGAAAAVRGAAGPAAAAQGDPRRGVAARHQRPGRPGAQDGCGQRQSVQGPPRHAPLRQVRPASALQLTFSPPSDQALPNFHTCPLCCPCSPNESCYKCYISLKLLRPHDTILVLCCTNAVSPCVRSRMRHF